MENLPGNQHDETVSNVDSAADGSYENNNEEDSDLCMFVAEETPEVASGPLDAAREALAEAMTAHAWQQDMEIDRDSKFEPFISGCTPAPTALGSQDLTSDSKTKIRVYGKERKVDRSSNKKHRPIAPKGSIFLAQMNTHLDRTKADVGVLQDHKLHIVLKDTNNNIHHHPYIDAKAAKWDDRKWVADVNKWRYQVFLRAFKKDPAESRPTRAKWTSVEKDYLVWLIKKKVMKTGERLGADEWNRIREKHNARWAGTKVRAGEKLPQGGVARTEQTITERSLVAIKGTFDRSVEMQQMVDEIVGAGVEQVVASDEEWFKSGVSEGSAVVAAGSEGGEMLEKEKVIERDSELFWCEDRGAFGLENEQYGDEENFASELEGSGDALDVEESWEQ